jgi:crotonobetainyl-CoA:carnitine CoA-transferase CaiB-like acyl-CoA transferase
MSPSFASSSRSKQSLGVDAKSEEGRALLLRLVQQSDVVIENNSTGTMDALGVGFDDLAATNPGIIMVSSQLMGTRGPWADWRGYGPSTQPPGGLVHLWNYADREDPAGSQAIFPDHFAGRLGAVASLAGLLGRARGTCGGLHAEVAQVEAVTGVLSDLLAAEAVEPGSVRPLGSRSERAAPWGMYPCAGDEQWVAITCRDDADWHALVDAMDAPPWADAALAAGPARLARQDELDDRIAEWTSQHSNEEIARRCQERGVPAGPMMTGLEMLTHPHYVARGFQVEIDQPGIGLITFDGPAFRGSAMRGPDVRPAPTLGQHTRQICRSLLSLDDAEIDRLLSNGVLDTTPPWKETHQ